MVSSRQQKHEKIPCSTQSLESAISAYSLCGIPLYSGAFRALRMSVSQSMSNTCSDFYIII